MNSFHVLFEVTQVLLHFGEPGPQRANCSKGHIRLHVREGKGCGLRLYVFTEVAKWNHVGRRVKRSRIELDEPDGGRVVEQGSNVSRQVLFGDVEPSIDRAKRSPEIMMLDQRMKLFQRKKALPLRKAWVSRVRSDGDQCAFNRHWTGSRDLGFVEWI